MEENHKDLTSLDNKSLVDVSSIESIQKMLSALLDNQEKIRDEIKQKAVPLETAYIDIDMREIEAFSFVHQNFDMLFSKLNYSQEYIPFWLISKERKYLERKIKKYLKLTSKKYRKQVRKERYAKFLNFFHKKKIK